MSEDYVGTSAPPQWASMVDAMIQRRAFSIVFQPIVDMQHRRLVGYEALTRFDVIEGHLVGPQPWFEAAHRLGRGVELELLTIQAALDYRAQLPPRCFLTVNASPTALMTPRIREVFEAEHDLNGIVIEITENERWDWEELKLAIHALRSRGALIAVDDAGSGYSGLQQILQLRPSIIKLDRELVDGVSVNEAKVALIEMILAFANRIDAEVLAEGIESVADANRVAEIGVELGQGYVLGMPSPPWVGMDVTTRQAMAHFSRQSGETLHRLLEDAPSMIQGVGASDDSIADAAPWLVALDMDGRPHGLVDAQGLDTGEIHTTLIANVTMEPIEVARRLVASRDEPTLPVIVTGDDGEYVGVVTLRRLLQRLAAAAPHEVNGVDDTWR